jgi:hypothetical protein
MLCNLLYNYWLFRGMSEEACNFFNIHCHENLKAHTVNCVGFQVVTAVVMKSSVFWDIAPCCLMKVNQCVGGMCQSLIICQTTNQHEAGSKQSSTPRPWSWSQDVPLKHQFAFSRLHGIISQNIELFGKLCVFLNFVNDSQY